MAAPKRSPTLSAVSPPGRRQRGRPPVISSDELLEIARRVFLEQGIRATTAEVAHRAGVSEGTLFHRFKSKDALFREAMRFDPAATPEPLSDIAGRAGQGELRETLVDVGTRMLAIGRVALPMMMMSWSNPGGEFSLEKLGDAGCRGRGYHQAFLNLRDFFEREIAAGRLHERNQPEALARIFMGSLHHFCMTELVLARDPVSTLSPKAYVEALVDLLLHGALTCSKEPDRRSDRRPR